MTVGELSTRSVATAHPDETVIEAARRMRDLHVGDLVVVDRQRRPVGLLTDRDIVVSAVAQSADRLGSLVVGDVMSSEPVVSRSDETVHTSLAKMGQHGIRRLPIVGDDGRLEGIVAFDDILELMSAELASLVGLVAHEQRQERTVRP